MQTWTGYVGESGRLCKVCGGYIRLVKKAAVKGVKKPQVAPRRAPAPYYTRGESYQGDSYARGEGYQGRNYNRGWGYQGRGYTRDGGYQGRNYNKYYRRH